MYTCGRKCNHLFYIEILDDLIDLEEGELMVLLGERGRTIRLDGVIFGTSMHMLLDLGASQFR